MRIRAAASAIPRHRFPVEPWRLVETEHDARDRGLTETLFAIGNGYIGMRANPSEGREAHTHGTYLNGFHETWPIKHAEDAFAFAKTGQTIVNVPDAKLMKLYVDDEPLLLPEADLDHYERALDFRTGTSHREVLWTTPAGKRLRVRSERMISLAHRHLAVLRFEVELLEGSAPVVVSSQLLNRQDGEDEYHVTDAALGEGRDPRQSRTFDDRVLIPQLQYHDDDGTTGGEVVLGYRCANSGMTLACAYRHLIETPCEYDVENVVGPDLAKTVFTIEAHEGETIVITKLVSYHSSRGIPAEELADRCHRTIERAAKTGVAQLQREQREWLDDFWARTDVELEGDDAAQQAVRWNLFQLAQASARTQEQGIAAKAVTGGGYDGHYFWDTEVYVLPCLAFTSPDAARKLLRFRWKMLDAARERAIELSEQGALYPWRTISGEEASAYYAAGTAQYHINAAVVFALEKYLNASGDIEFLAHEGAEILVETARMWADLGFFEHNGNDRFRIHGVTGPDEYTTVVDDNLYTNVMARFNLRYAARTVSFLAEWSPDDYEALQRATGVTTAEIQRWKACADAMYLPYDDKLGIHPQDDSFLDREPWNFANTPPDQYPLLLHYHPLVIYRHQVLKQADVVLAMYLQGRHFSREEKRRNFEYYDPITTGDSSLSACVQSIVAAETGHADLALDYFHQSLYLDLADTHGNTTDGVHVANAAGVWATMVHGFTGMVDTGEHLRFAPRLPATWSSLRFHLLRHGSRLQVIVDPDGATVELLDGLPVPIQVGVPISRKGKDPDHPLEFVCEDSPVRIPRPAD
ncbi:MAG: glycosyl hydrolase family 65 protein [Acidimicrobiales bacterium]|nr:glycosyl hydrolase family 65 protein [Acidimicrobiales bacterium]